MRLNDEMYVKLGVAPELIALANDVEDSLKERFLKIDEVAEYNQLQVLSAMQ